MFAYKKASFFFLPADVKLGSKSFQDNFILMCSCARHGQLESTKLTNKKCSSGSLEDNYEVEKVLGAGGYGIVYAGKRKNDNMEMVIKTLEIFRAMLVFFFAGDWLQSSSGVGADPICPECGRSSEVVILF